MIFQLNKSEDEKRTAYFALKTTMAAVDLAKIITIRSSATPSFWTEPSTPKIWKA